MIVNCIFDATVLTKKEKESKTEKGKFFYKIGVIKDDELGELNCNEEVYNAVVKGKPYRLHCSFNTQYNSFSVNGADDLQDLYEAAQQASKSKKKDDSGAQA